LLQKQESVVLSKDPHYEFVMRHEWAHFDSRSIAPRN